MKIRAAKFDDLIKIKELCVRNNLQVEKINKEVWKNFPDYNNFESATEKKNINNDKSEEEKLMEEVLSSREEKLRLLAEMEILRKRIEREKIESIKFGSINLAREILSLGDNLERALFVNYCKCIKNLTYSKTVRKGAAYPICVSSIYKRRKKTPPKDLKKRCKKYR